MFVKGKDRFRETIEEGSTSDFQDGGVISFSFNIKFTETVKRFILVFDSTACIWVKNNIL